MLIDTLKDRTIEQLYAIMDEQIFEYNEKHKKYK